MCLSLGVQAKLSCWLVCISHTFVSVAGLIFLYCCIAALTVVPWKRSKRESYAIRSFNGYWHARALLLLTGGLWVVGFHNLVTCQAYRLYSMSYTA